MEAKKTFDMNSYENLLKNLTLVKPTYKRKLLEKIIEEKQNYVDYFQSNHGNFIFYPYNSESIRDFGWGCAWRAIQSIVNNFFRINLKCELMISFEDLFNYFGNKATLLDLYCKLYSQEIDSLKHKALIEAKFAPHDNESGWAEPFIGHLCLYYFNVPSDLFLINGIPDHHYTPKEVFVKTFDFKEFIVLLQNKMTLPVMLDDGIFALTILEVDKLENCYKLKIGDPHINEKTPKGTCFYEVYLDEFGSQIKHSIDENQAKNMFNAGSYKGIHFKEKCWMCLFPN